MRVRVRFLQSVASAAWHHDVNDVAELDRDVARNYIKANVAERVDETVPVGRAALPSGCPRCGMERSEFQQWCAACGSAA